MIFTKNFFAIRRELGRSMPTLRDISILYLSFT
jgi:hypothetical protein